MIKNKKKELMLLILGLICLVLITAGVTYAFFNYTKEGTTDNTITTGTITFLYTETSGVGKGISLEDAYPISDSVGKVQTGEGKVFDFKVTSNTPNSSSISYEVTARKKDTSTLREDAVKLYLTKVTGTTEEEVILSKYNELTPTTKVDSSRYNEKILYQGKVPANTTDYEQAFRLRMWIDESVDFSDGTMNDKEFTVTVNVYANAKVVSADEGALLSSTDITSVEVDEKAATASTDADYDYEVELATGTENAIIRIATLNEYASVEVEKIDSVAYRNNVERLSASKTVDLTSGDNYFKITVTSENKENTKEYKLKVVVPKDTIDTLSSLSVTNCPLNELFNSETTEYTCTTKESKITVSATATSSKASIEGIREKELVTGDNTITITVTSESGLEKVYTVTVTKVNITSFKFNSDTELISSGTPTFYDNYINLNSNQRLYTNNNLVLSNKFTVLIKVRNLKLSSTDGSNEYALLFGNGNQNSGIGSYIVGVFLTPKYIITSLGSGDFNSIETSNSYVFDNSNEWKTIVMRYDGSTATLWINGEKLGEKTAPLSAKNTVFSIGGFPNSGISHSGVYWGYVNGDYSNCVIYDLPLSDEEIINFDFNNI